MLLTRLFIFTFALFILSCSTHQPVNKASLLTTQIKPQLKQNFSSFKQDNISDLDQASSKVERNWWQSFNNKALDHWVTLALNNNPSLKATVKRLESAQAKANSINANNNPDLDLSINSKKRFLEGNSSSNQHFIGLSTRWEVDLWGAIAANEQKAQWETVASENTTRIQANLIAANVSQAWISWVAQYKTAQLLKQQKMRTEQGINVIERRASLGKAPISDLWQQQSLAQSLDTLLTKAEAQSDLQRQKLALWLGIASDKLPLIPNESLPQLPALPKMGIPLEQLKYRPDIEKSYAQLKAADANVAIAIADQFPQLTLKANYNLAANSASQLFSHWVADIGANLLLPLIDSGTREYVIKQRKRQLSALTFDYIEQWQQAIYSVEQALITEHQFQQMKKSLEVQLSLTKKTLQLKTIYYLNGQAHYLQLLQAQESVLKLERQVINVFQAQLIARIKLYSAISHGDFIPLYNSKVAGSDPVKG